MQVLVSAALMERAAVTSTSSMAAARRLAYSGSGSVHDGSAHDGSARGHIATALTLDTIDVTAGRGDKAPAGAVSHARVLPGSCELLSHTNLGPGETARELSLHLNVFGAPWAPPLMLAPGRRRDEGQQAQRTADPLAAASESLREGRPVLLRAHNMETDVVLDVVAHLQVRVQYRCPSVSRGPSPYQFSRRRASHANSTF
jgi:hypothetical protein